MRHLSAWEDLLRLAITGEPDVFLVRQRGREVAEAVGLESQDQIRVATVLSDLGRDLVRQSASATVTFGLRTMAPAALLIEFGWRGGSATTKAELGRNTANRLMDEVRITERDGRFIITLVKNLPTGLPDFTAGQVVRIQHDLDVLRAGNALDELRAQNQQLLETLENLEVKSSELERLNEELEDTNRGVVALYKELSEELEQTNLGVVALYAELNEKSSQLKDAGEAKTRFWSNISHELRTPINSVLGLARLLSSPGGDPLTEDQHRQVRLINDSGATLLSLVNELLDTAKAESGKLKAHLEPVDLGVLFTQLRGTIRPMVPSNDVSLVIEDPPALPQVVTDETMLARILRNLLSNGLKFTERGEVRLTVRLDEDHLRFVVADTGIGIPEDQLDKVFEEFHQVPSSRQVGAAGTGLGLPYARRLAEILGGSLTLSSGDTGTEVVLRLPVGDLDNAPLPAIGITLLVDDDEEFRDRFKGMLGDLTGDVVEAPDGRAALDFVTRTRPDLVFLDLHMPLMNGGDVLAVIRQKPGLSGVPVVVVTSGDADGFDLSAAGLAASLLLKSHLSPESIRQAVREALAAAPRTVPR
jgi:signal transduction histidine kinase/CheY-like chemotaxis protein